MSEEPNGCISFTVGLPPTSQQARRATKDAFTHQCRQAMSAHPFILYGEVKIHVEWSIHEQDRYESDAAPDVDNIIKPLLDGLHGPDTLLIDDCQVQEICCSWIDSPAHEQSVSITICHSPDYWFRRGPLRFVEFGKHLCMPLVEDIPKDGKLLMLASWQKSFQMRDAFLSEGWDWYSANGVMPILRPFHKSRVVSKYPVILLDDLVRELTGSTVLSLEALL